MKKNKHFFIVCALLLICFVVLIIGISDRKNLPPTIVAKEQAIGAGSRTLKYDVLHNTALPSKSGLFHKVFSIAGKEVNIYGNIVDPSKTRIKIISPDTIANEQYTTGLSLKEYMKLGRYKAVYSGGYLSSWSPPLPLGYLKIDGKTLNRAHNTYLTKGLFCARDGKTLVSSFKDSSQLDEWDDCMQTGTPLVEDGKAVIDQSREGWYITNQPNVQAFICQYQDGKILIGMSKEETNLSSLTDYLATPESEGGMGCINAIGRAGGRTAGMIINKSGEIQEFGNTEIPLPNALAIK